MQIKPLTDEDVLNIRMNKGFSKLDKIYNDLMQRFDDNLSKALIDRLGKLGYVFNNEKELIEFVKNRVSRIVYKDLENEYWEWYLDYNHEKRTGVFLLNYTGWLTSNSFMEDGIIKFNYKFGITQKWIPKKKYRQE